MANIQISFTICAPANLLTCKLTIPFTNDQILIHPINREVEEGDDD